LIARWKRQYLELKNAERAAKGLAPRPGDELDWSFKSKTVLRKGA
jgi:hypothetical protein